MCVQLRPVIKDDSMLQAVFKVCLKYTSTQNMCTRDIYVKKIALFIFMNEALSCIS